MSGFGSYAYQQAAQIARDNALKAGQRGQDLRSNASLLHWRQTQVEWESTSAIRYREQSQKFINEVQETAQQMEELTSMMNAYANEVQQAEASDQILG
jgi:hypothetical protein